MRTNRWIPKWVCGQDKRGTSDQSTRSRMGTELWTRASKWRDPSREYLPGPDFEWSRCRHCSFLPAVTSPPGRTSCWTSQRRLAAGLAELGRQSWSLCSLRSEWSGRSEVLCPRQRGRRFCLKLVTESIPVSEMAVFTLFKFWSTKEDLDIFCCCT